MKQLALALYAEGRTDERFLPVIIQRAADRILLQRALTPVEVVPLSLMTGSRKESQAKRILQVARQAAGFYALIIHADADAPTADKSLQDRFEPGRWLVRESTGNICRDLLPTL